MSNLSYASSKTYYESYLAAVKAEEIAYTELSFTPNVEQMLGLNALAWRKGARAITSCQN